MAPVTVTGCATFQLSGVNVKFPGATVPAVSKFEINAKTTSASGFEVKATRNDAVAPAWLVCRPLAGLILKPACMVPMFVTLTDGVTLDDRIENEIKTRLRREYTPRHIPDKIIQVPAIPTTITGKKLEVPVRKILLGVPPEQAANTSAMADPSSLDAFIDYARTQHDYTIQAEP